MKTHQLQWIDVTKKTPPNGIELLCISDHGKFAIGSIRLYTNPSVRYVCYKSSKVVLNNVTHYMELPKPPKKKEPKPHIEQDLLDAAFAMINGGDDDDLEEALQIIERYGRNPKR